MGTRGAKHTKVQRLGRERDFNICQVCGSKVRTEGHHFIDFQFGGAADVDNIITLCHNCHKQVHRGKIDLLKF